MKPASCAVVVGAPVLLATIVTVVQCVQPECATSDYTDAECRVVAENELARIHTSTGVEVRFQHPDATTVESWDARGLVEELEPGVVRARVAGPGRFAISIEAEPSAPAFVQLILDNVDPAAIVEVGPLGAEVDVPPPTQPGTRRELLIPVSSDEPIWVRGRRLCPSAYRLAVAGDIQTNPEQFERIVERLQTEADEAEAAGQPLVGLLIAGDISESSRDDELQIVEDILESLPVPAAMTAGNHDVYRRLHPNYNRHFGPGNHAFDVCSTHVVMLDTGSGAIARSVEGRLPELLDRGDADFVIAAMHHPPYPGLTGAGWSQENQAQRVMAELAAARTDLIVTGHYHALRQFTDIDVGDRSLREIIAGTAGAYQGLGRARYGYVRLTFTDTLQACFVEVPPPGWADPPNDPVDGLPYCED